MMNIVLQCDECLEVVGGAVLNLEKAVISKDLGQIIHRLFSKFTEAPVYNSINFETGKVKCRNCITKEN